MNWVGEQMLGYGRTFPASHIKRKLARLTPQDIQQAAVDFFSPERYNLALVTPLKSARSFHRWFAS
jgi:predicted Zn-dependent peptidase